MSRQRRWQLDKISSGVCSICGDEPLFGKSLGLKCLKKNRKESFRRSREVRGIPLDRPKGNRGRKRLEKKFPKLLVQNADGNGH